MARKKQKDQVQMPISVPAEAESTAPTPDNDSTGASDASTDHSETSSAPTESQTIRDASSKTYKDATTGRELTVVSNGETRRSPRAYLLDIFIHDQADLKVVVPVTMVGDTFLYKFLQDLEAGRGYEDFSVSRTAIKSIAAEIARYRAYLGLMYSAKPDEWVRDDGNHIAEGEWPWQRIIEPGKWYNTRSFETVYVAGDEIPRIISPLQEAGLSEEAINYILTKAMEQVDRELIGKNLLPVALRHSLESEMFEFGPYDSADIFDFDNVVASIGTVQTIYARACQQMSLDAFAADLSRFISADQRLAFCLNLNRLFRESTSPAVPVSFSALMESVAPAMSQQSVVTGHSLMNGLIYIVDAIAPDLDLDDVTRPVIMEFVFRMVRAYTGLAERLDNWEVARSISLETDLHSQSKAWRLGWPVEVLRSDPNARERFISEEQLSSGFGKLEILFKRLFFRALVKCAGTRDEGSLMAAFLSVLDERAITRSDTWDYVVTSSLRAVSMFHQAFCDVFTFFLTLAQSDDIMWAGESRDEYRSLLLTYFDKELGPFRETHVSREEPAFAREASSLFAGTTILPEPDKISWIYPDAVLRDRNSANFDPFSGSFKFLYRHDILQGDVFGLPASLNTLQKKIYQRGEYAHLASTLHVFYAMTRDVSSFFDGTDMGITYMRFQDIRDLAGAGILEWFKNKCKAEVYISAADLASAHNMPMFIAEDIFKRNGLDTGLGFITLFRFDSALTQTIIWDEALAPIYELGKERDDDPRYYVRFKSLWPALVSASVPEHVQPLFHIGDDR